MYSNLNTLDVLKRLEEESINKNSSTWDKKTNSGVIKISFLNTRLIVRKFDNIKFELKLQ